MNIAVVAARILLGLAFVAAGASGFFLINNPPPAPPGLAGTFQNVFFQSRWVLFVDAIELSAGVMLLTNRFVTLALTLLGAVIANIIVYHITLMPAGLPAAVVVTVLWSIVFARYRAGFAPVFAPHLTENAGVVSSVSGFGQKADRHVRRGWA